MIFWQFTLRSMHYFQRNVAAGALPFLMPLVFLFLFVSSSSNLAQAPQLTLEQMSEPTSSRQMQAVERLQRSGLVTLVSPSTSRKSTLSFDGKLAFGSGPGEGIAVTLKPGFEHWGKLISYVVAGGALDAAPGSTSVRYGRIERASYLEFIIPGLFVMALIQISTTATAGVVLDDRADGTLRMIASARRALVPYFAAELATRLVFAAVSYGFMAVLVTMLAHFSPIGGWLSFSLIYLLGAITMISFGLLIGGILPSRSGWSSSITILSLLMWFFSDILFQASQHPVARPLALVIPSTYVTDALRQVSTAGAGTFSLWQDSVVLVAIAAVSAGLAIRFFKFDTRD